MKQGSDVKYEQVLFSSKYVEIISHLLQSEFTYTERGREHFNSFRHWAQLWLEQPIAYRNSSASICISVSNICVSV